jgi:hypothetical protein
MVALAFPLFAADPTQRQSSARITAESNAGQDKKDPLVELNNRFRIAYAQARKELLAKQGPIIIADGDSVVLLRASRRTEVNVAAMSDIVKPIAHTPLAIHSFLGSAGGADLTEERLKELRTIRELIEPAGKSLQGRGLPEEIHLLHMQILAESAKFLDDVLATKKVNSDALLAFTRKLGPLLETSAGYAAATLLDATHKQVMAWKAEMTLPEWGQLRVVIPGSAAPRKDNWRVQYFARLLGEKGECERIIYAEAIFDDTRILNRLASYQLDTVIGNDFFNDPARMHRDLLANGAAPHLKKMEFDPPE